MGPSLSRGLLRVVLVVALATASQAIELPEIIPQLVPIYGSFGFQANDVNDVVLVPDDSRRGIAQGDHINLQAMPRDDWHASAMFRLAPVGKRVTFHMTHNGVPYTVTRVATFNPDAPVSTRGPDLWIGGILWTAASLVLVLVGTALVLVRPSRITWAFFLYACGTPTANLVWFYSFLPPAGYLAVSALSFAVGALAPFGFLLVALRLACDPPTGWRRTCDRAAPWVFLAPFVATVGAAIEHGFGRPFHVWNQVYFWSATTFYAVAIASLLGSLRNRRLELRLPVRWTLAGFAISGVGAVVGLVFAYFEGIIPEAIYFPAGILNAAFAFSLVISLVVAYVLVRYRVVDVQYVLARSLAYATVAAAVLATFAVVNLAFAKWVYYIAVVIPLEIIVALLLGYRFSGLANVAGALALADIDAPTARLRGRRAEEREILARALDRAERTRRTGLVTEVRARAAFSAWLAGEDDEFTRHIDALQIAAGNRDLRGLGFFLRAARGQTDERDPSPADLPEWVARAYLVACGNSDDAAAAARYAAGAVAAADASDASELQVLVRVASAEFSAADRKALYIEATRFAELSSSLKLQKAVHALQHDARDAGILAPFIARLRSPREAAPALEVRFLTAEVLRCGVPVTLRESERALLFALAHRPTLTPTAALTDALWPELDGDAAAAAFRVCVHRLRRGLGDPRSLVRTDRGYSLQSGAVADLWRIVEVVDAARSAETLGRGDQPALLTLHAKLRATRAVWASQPAWFAPYLAELTELTRDAAHALAHDALVRGDASAALDFARAMIEDDPFDEAARAIAIRAHLVANDHLAAMREYRRYADFLSTEQVSRPLTMLEALLGAPPAASERTG